MVAHASADKYDTAYVEWRPLLAACEVYAQLSGWRFVRADFMRLESKGESEELRTAREQAMPMALEFADRVASCKQALAEGAEPPRLLTEFQVCQRLVATEAVFNSMVATIAAVGLEEGAGASMRTALDGNNNEDPDRYAFQDMTQPVEVIARRLLAYRELVEGEPSAREERRRRLLQASFVVEFGLEHGLPDFRDRTSEGMLTDFLTRLGEWEGGRNSATVRALVLDSLPPGPAGKGLREAALDWFENHKTAAIFGGAIVGGLIGVLAASAAVAVASAATRGRSSR